MKKFWDKTLIAALCALILPLAACSEPGSSSSPQASDAKTELRIACQYAGTDLKNLVSAFNRQSEEYKVTLVKYDQLGSQDLLLSEITTGNAPDIFAFYSGGFLEETDTSGAYEDLLPYFDTELIDTLIPSLYGALTKSGKLYWMPYDFTVDTYAAQESVAGRVDELTMEKAEELANDLDISVFPPWQTKEELLTRVFAFSMGQFIDEETNTCSFDSKDFIALLEQCDEQPAELPESDDIMVEKSLLISCTMQNFSIALNLKRTYGDDYCFVGFPTRDGGESCFDLNLQFAIYARSENKDCAWAFIQFALKEESQENTDHFPVTQKALDAMIERALTDGQTNMDSGLVGLEQTDVDKMVKLIENTTEVSSSKAAIFDIITDEAQDYFYGEQTAEEAANQIRSKVSIYLAEHG